MRDYSSIEADTISRLDGRWIKLLPCGYVFLVATTRRVLFCVTSGILSEYRIRWSKDHSAREGRVLDWGHVHENCPAHTAREGTSSRYQVTVMCTYVFAKEDTLIAAEAYDLVFGTADIRALSPNIKVSARALRTGTLP
jgi:hypothetical protein